MKNFKNKAMSIKAIGILFLFMAIWASDLKSQEVDNKQNTTLKKQGNTRTSVYFHPASLLSTIGTNLDEDTYSDAVLLYLTIENPIDLSKSLIMRPSFWNVKGRINELYLTNAFRFGSDIGLRYYLNEKGDGFYLQGQTGIFFISNNSGENFVWFDIMGYLGYSKKYAGVSIFFDVGLGLLLTGDRFSLPDINLGIGFPLGN